MVSFGGSRGMIIGQLVGAMLALILLVSTPVGAQVVGATLSGTITDNSGASVPGARVTIKNVATGVTRELTSDSAGFYQAINLDAGSYAVTVAASGFKTAVQSGVTLVVGTPQALNITMQVGEVSQTVEVTTEAPVVQLTSSSIGNLINSTTVVELPLNGRDWGALANLAPGVSGISQVQQGTGTTVPKGNRGYGNQMTVAGTRPQMNNYRLDGVSIVDYAGGTPASVLALTLGVDAIGEFSVVTSNHSAEYGRTSGGVINAITKSGTNRFHGDAYWFIRDEGFDARSATDASKLPFHRNQFGGSIGGPIYKDKTFFFTNIESFRQVRSTSSNDKVPTVNNRNGFVTAPGSAIVPDLTGNCPAGYQAPVGPAPAGFTAICMWSKSLPFLAVYPTPPPSAPGDVAIVSVALPAVAIENYYTARIDHTISSKDSLSGSFFIDPASNSAPDVLLTTLNGNTSRRTMVTASENHIFSSALINSVRIGYSRQHMTQNNFLQCLNQVACVTDSPLSSLPGRYAAQVNITGLNIFSGGPHSLTVNTQVWNSYQLYDDAFLTKGSHSMKFGFTVENMRHAPSNVQSLNANWFFPSWIAFLQNSPQSLRLPPTNGFAYPNLRQTLFGGYFQDDWRIKSNLTLNLGLRYEAATVMKEVNGIIQNLPTVSSITPVIGNPLYHNPTLRNFEPRVGFAWDPFKDGKTSIRGAFGVFDVLPLILELFTNVQQDPPPPYGGLVNLSQNVLQADNVQFPIAPPRGIGKVLPYNDTNPKRNYVMVWNVSAQRQLTANTSVTVGYVANRGVHNAERFGTMNMDQPVGYTAAGYPYWLGGTVGGVNQIGKGTLINPGAQTIQGIMWDGDSHYHALEVSVEKRFSHGFQAQGGYTYGKSIDTNSAATISDPYLNSISTLYWFCKICRVGPSDFNITNKLSASFIWDLPTPKFGGVFGSKVLGGWELGDIISASSGTPFSVLIGGDPQGTNSPDSPNQVFPNYTPGCNPVNSGGLAAQKINYINNSCFTLPTAPAGSNIACSAFGANSAGVGGIAGTCANLQGNEPRNLLTGPGLFNMDFSVIKNTKFPRISETLNVQFRAEMFYVINHPSWAAPINPSLPNVFNADGSSVTSQGVLNTVTVPGREIQFGLKLIF